MVGCVRRLTRQTNNSFCLTVRRRFSASAGNSSVAALLERQAAASPDALCIVDTSRANQKWTYAETHQKAAALSMGLRFAG